MKKMPKSLRGPGRPSLVQGTVVSDEEILDVAFRMFFESGYEGASLRSLGSQLAISHNLISARFGSKAELWKKAFARRISLQVPPIVKVFDDEFETYQEQLRTLILRYTELAYHDGGLAGLVALETTQGTWRTKFILDNYVKHFYARLETLLINVGLESGTKPMPPSPFIMLMVHGIGAYFNSRPLLRLLESDVICDKYSATDFAEIFCEILLPRVTGNDKKKPLLSN